jgi:hypothetical protein
MDTQTLLAILGIALSGLFFFVGYRQTIGARKERVRAANKDIVATLVKRLMLEGVLPNRDEFSYYLGGKARDNLLKKTDLLSPAQIIETLYSKILDDDFIEPGKRKLLLENLQRSASKEVETQVSVGFEYPERRWRAAVVLLITSATLGSVLVAAGDLLQSSDVFEIRRTVQLAMLTFSLAALLIGALSVFRRLQEREEETTPAEMADPLRFERAIRSLLQSKNISLEHANYGPYDFEFRTEKGLYLVELKASLRRIPRPVLRRMKSMLEESLQRSKAKGALIVTAEPVLRSMKMEFPPLIRVMDLAELHRFLEEA